MNPATIRTTSPLRGLDRPALGAGHALGDLAQVDMVVAPRGGGNADEHAPGEECRGRLLQPQPGIAEGTRHHVEEDAQSKAADEHPAQGHQPGLQWW